LDNIKWNSSDSASTNDGDEANSDVNGQLELNELSDVIENGSTIFDGSVDRLEIVI